MNTTLIFSVYYGSLRKEIVNKLMTEIVFIFGRDNAIQLKEDIEVTIKND